MYAIIKTGGKQYTVKPGDVLDVEKLEGEAGDSVNLPVLFLNADGKIVTDAEELAKTTVTAQILDQFKGKKALVFKFKKRKGYKKLRGHRQNLTKVFITEVAGATAQPQPKAAKAEKAPKAEAPKAEAPKAEKVAEAPKAEAAAPAEDLSKLTVAQLKELAAEKGIKLASGARKAEIIETIQNA